MADDIKKEEWNRFVLRQNGSFLQSFEWGEFQESFGRRVFRFIDLEAGFAAQFIEHSLPFGKKYWYGPKSPVFNLPAPFLKGGKEGLKGFFSGIKEEAKKNGAMFFRIGPELSIDQLDNCSIEQLQFQKLSYDIEPSQTLILDLNKTEDELLAQMRPKWRYNINLAQKKGLKISNCQFPISNYQFQAFWNLLKSTAERQKIRLHEKEYYWKMIGGSKSAPPQPSPFKGEGVSFESHIFIASYRDKPIVANLVNVFGNRATYLHGGSDNEFRNLMAPHLLQWEQIKFAKSLGCQEYDFWGIDEKKWPGVTRFKLGFGGQQVKYIGAWDYPLDKKWYLVYRGAQRFRR